MAATRSHKLIRLDGRMLEGGGQLVRNALVLAALTYQPVEITHIRGNRSGGGGLKAQHLACVRWLQRATDAHVEGAERGSRSLLFDPGPVDRCGGVSPVFKKIARPDGEGQMYEVRVDVETAGSTGLVLQAILPYVLFSKLESNIPIRLLVSGGTNVSGAPSYEYVSQVLLPMLHTIGFPPMMSKLEMRGWSHGGTSIGHFSITIPASRSSVLPAFQLLGPAAVEARRQVAHLTANFLAPAHCHQHFQAIMPSLLHRYFSITREHITVTCEDTRHDKRLYLILIAELPSRAPHKRPIFLARDELYCRKLPACGGHMRATTEMAERTAADLDAEVRSGTCVDEHMRDQLVIFQALAEGRSEIFPGYVLDEDDDEAQDGEESKGQAEDEEGGNQEDDETNSLRLHSRAGLPLRESRFHGDRGAPSPRTKQREKSKRKQNRRARTTFAVPDLDEHDDPFERESPASPPESAEATEPVHEGASHALHTTSDVSSRRPRSAGGTLLRPASLHARTAEWVAGQFLPHHRHGQDHDDSGADGNMGL
nr:rna 3'-terminal phosphate cyclase [Quercus suber]